MNRRHWGGMLAVALIAAGAGLTSTPGGAAEGKPEARRKMSLAQARQTVDMLNDLYVNAVVITHSTYVKDRATPPSALPARKVFAAMAQKGWPETRWLATTGRPFNPDANPKDQFERDAIAALKKGQARFERQEGGNLRVATLVPLVDKSCQMCHTKDKVGDPIGGLSYTVALNGQ
ncbi:MAG: c-type heme family protein [Actinomycetota bacterium]